MKKTIRSLLISLAGSIGLKKLAKFTYYFLGYQISRILKKEAYSSHEVTELGDSDQQSFFGYFDKSPESSDGKYVAYHETRLKTHRKPTTGADGVDIVLMDRETSSISKIGTTQAFNWQQGARLMWLSPTELIYNIYEKGYRSVLYDISSKQSKTISKPIYDCHENVYALTLNFERLDAFSPDYGYRCHDQKDLLPGIDQDGIWKIDLSNNQSSLMITLERLVKLSTKKTMEGAKHWVNHIMISPDGNRFMFLHRWSLQSKRYDRLLYYDFTTDELQILADQDLVSHCFWIDNNRIVGFMNDSDGKSKLMILDIKQGTSSEFKYSQSADVHMNVFENKMLFDTYPDFYRLKTLGIVDLVTQKSTMLGRFREPLRYYKETRCDLHSRFNHSGNRVYFDSVHTGKRKLYFIETGV